ncbi:transposase IS3/IS911 family protein [Turneriella parva DSM 21527]|uniref:Transposase IS3/IS911 family protein n=1 Tax=Turneriella parva (strain ATCC BAA-1111 / DSM 21527 / NCTC 11395 / H) TaxID=869212 RepID=I4B7P2_TURPD|nr:transposase IS3/IS911 family protein [Turneriella parva DSM 21527]AFM12005.1 transposase IS3/IS911 family protein [Turneriella parva DSM 21527]AFM12154.1 transposase IS3/IS911 family protein [Turneriella parva DSM 21527]AFM12365.1 transposase IS3/IS911 family protein [Turneriella parva DSM 21527]AFM12569.1 transposase IS3/IS911 family protein [Turneriella parva DSM 21527]
MNNDSTKAKVELVTTVQRRRRWSVAEKLEILVEAEQPGMSMSYVARKHGIAATQIFKWKKLKEAGALTAVGSEEEVLPVSQVRQLQERIRRLESILGRKTEEVEILKEAVRIGREKKLISHKPLRGIEGFE